MRKLVLVVDDNRAERELYGELLWYNGFDVVFAEDGEEGLRLAEERRPAAAIVDIVMPRMDGLALCRRLKQMPHTRDILVLALTGQPESELGRAAREAGCVRYLEKPIGPIDVLHHLEELIGRQPLAGEVGTGPSQVHRLDRGHRATSAARQAGPPLEPVRTSRRPERRPRGGWEAGE